MNNYGIELKKEIEKRGIKYLACMVFLDKDEVDFDELTTLWSGINHEVLFFVTFFPQKFFKSFVEKKRNKQYSYYNCKK